jgi:hypothetical protein
MPTPTNTEDQGSFIRRCIPLVLKDKTASNPKQAYAVCLSMWNQAKAKNHDETLGFVPLDTGEEPERILISSL